MGAIGMAARSSVRKGIMVVPGVPEVSGVTVVHLRLPPVPFEGVYRQYPQYLAVRVAQKMTTQTPISIFFIMKI